MSESKARKAAIATASVVAAAVSGQPSPSTVTQFESAVDSSSAPIESKIESNNDSQESAIRSDNAPKTSQPN